MVDVAIQYAIMVALAFVILSHPMIYKFTDKWSRQLVKQPLADGGCPNIKGLVVHGAVAGALVYYLLSKQFLVPRMVGM